MDAYTPAEWAGLFGAELGAAATLTGLLLVAVSLNLARILEFAGLPRRVLEALLLLGSVLFLSTLVLGPGQALGPLAAELVVRGAVLLGSPLVLDVGTWRRTAPEFRRGLLDREARAGGVTPSGGTRSPQQAMRSHPLPRDSGRVARVSILCPVTAAVATGNHLLASLDRQTLAEVATQAQHVCLPERALMYEAGEPITHVHFPLCGLGDQRGRERHFGRPHRRGKHTHRAQGRFDALVALREELGQAAPTPRTAGVEPVQVAIWPSVGSETTAGVNSVLGSRPTMPGRKRASHGSASASSWAIESKSR